MPSRRHKNQRTDRQYKTMAKRKRSQRQTMVDKIVMEI